MSTISKKIFVGAILAISAVIGFQQTILTHETSAAGTTPKAGITFNDPYGSASKRNAILDKVYGAIDATKKNHVIRVTTYSIRDPKAAEKLIKAHKRGVIVQIVIHDQLLRNADEKDKDDPAKPLLDLINALGTKVVYDSSKSFVKVCKNSCASTHPDSSVHSKVYLFSTAGSAKRVTMVASSNLSVGHSYAWNNLYTTVGNTTLYNNLLDDFYKIAKEPNGANLYRNVAIDKNIRLYTFPRETANGLKDDVHYTMLEKVRCTGASKGYGIDGKTALDFAMFKWTTNRSAVAEKLRSLADSGCRVRVITDKANMDSDILKILTAKKNGKNSPIVVKDGYQKSGGVERYMHHKYITINGYYVDANLTDAENRKSKIVFTGSPNLSSTGIRRNNEVMLRLRYDSAHKSYTSNFEKIYKSYSKQITY